MIKSISLVLSVASAVLAQSSSSSAPATNPSSSSSPLIPSNISSSCQSFLTALNQDTSLNSCTAPLISAASAYGPGGKSADAPTIAQLTSSLDTLCSSTSSSCSESTVRAKLADFYSACSAELTSSPNNDVIRTYDVLYILKPLQNALCTKNDNGDYCVTKAKLPGSSAAANGLSNALVSTGPSPADIQNYLAQDVTLARRAATAALVPNTTTFANSNLPFLFLQPTDSSETLCNACTRSIITAYINFESSVPYAPGLSASLMLNKQPDLYKGVTDTCGSNFLSGAVQAAGGLKGGILGNGSPRSVGGESALTFMAVILGATAVAFSVL